MQDLNLQHIVPETIALPLSLYSIIPFKSPNPNKNIKCNHDEQNVSTHHDSSAYSTLPKEYTNACFIK